MKYLKYRNLYRALCRVKSIHLKADFLLKCDADFQDFFTLMTDRKMQRLSDTLDAIIKKEVA